MASYSLDIRLAVASAAKANLPCGGTAAPFGSPVKYITVANLNEESVTQKQSFFNNKGPKIGENPLWLNPESQIWDWINITDLTADYVVGKVLGIAKVWTGEVVSVKVVNFSLPILGKNTEEVADLPLASCHKSRFDA